MTTTATATATIPAPTSPIYLAASKDDMRPVLGGVNIADFRGVPSYIACDSYVLAVVPIGADAYIPDGGALIPSDMAEGAYKASLKGGSGSISVDGDLVNATLSPKGKRSSTLHGEQIIGQFPDAEQLMPKDLPIVSIGVSVDRLLQLAKALGAGKGNVVILDVIAPGKPIGMRLSNDDGPCGICMPVRITK